ncbi:hypothetical protein Pcinc_013121 [Petrolisthes cinctipes]|uniref:Uncharacterized protein n=1 Tax=Petrolisthes cinctipes TaxID=88211 RepID=A0AAE1KUM2_PETCI|nr:hypothetical protein Pcinc_013121 [Petrolisthes cinctipes]
MEGLDNMASLSPINTKVKEEETDPDFLISCSDQIIVESDGYRETIEVQYGDMALKEEVDVKAEVETLEEEKYSADQEK